jgi:glycosyltransferase involved in cell wall biosynthesis
VGFQMRIVFACHGLDFNGHSLLEAGLGGSETAVASLAAEFASLGHKVFVYCVCSKPGQYDGVIYRSIEQLSSYMAFSRPDVFVASRLPEFLRYGSRASYRALWLHDMPNDMEKFSSFLPWADSVFVLSEYQEQQYTSQSPHLHRVLQRTSNGVSRKLVASTLALQSASLQSEISRKKSPQFLYSSCKHRGLLRLVKDIFPEILKLCPDATLKVCGYVNPAAESQPQTKQLVSLISKYADKLGRSVQFIGSLPKPELYKVIAESTAILYPTDFPEISCITAMEAQALGTPIVSTDAFALSETIGAPTLVSATDVDSSEYREAFVGLVWRLLNDDEFYSSVVAAGKQHVAQKGYYWDAVAKSWEGKFLSVFRERKEDSSRLAKELYRTGNTLVAEKLLKLGTREAAESSFDIDVLQEMFLAAVRRAKQILLSENKPCQSVALFGSYADRLLDIAANEFPEVCLAKGYGGSGEEKVDLLVSCFLADLAEYPGKTLRELRVEQAKTGAMLLNISQFAGESTRFYDNIRDWRRWGLCQEDMEDLFFKCDSARHSPIPLRPDGSLGAWCTLISVGDMRDIGDLSVESVVRRTRPYESVSLRMICGNDHKWLDVCLDSVYQVVDELVIFATASLPNAEYLESKYGAHVKFVDFVDFAETRNVSLQDASTDWIMWIDSDEQLVGSQNIRQYLSMPFCEGLVLRQNHLMLDATLPHDNPVRLFRNRPHYRFVGCIHEHPENTLLGYDSPVAPAFVIPDAQIAHYGYVTEGIRRNKCSARNLPLLLKDVEQNGKNGRMLTWVLVIRDYLNLVKWLREDSPDACSYGSQFHAALEAAVTTYHAVVDKLNQGYVTQADKFYQEALYFLAQKGFPYRPMGVVPFAKEILLRDIGDEDEISPRLFLTEKEYQQFVYNLAGGNVAPWRVPVPWSQIPDPAAILSSAVGM